MVINPLSVGIMLLFKLSYAFSITAYAVNIAWLLYYQVNSLI